MLPEVEGGQSSLYPPAWTLLSPETGLQAPAPVGGEVGEPSTVRVAYADARRLREENVVDNVAAEEARRSGRADTTAENTEVVGSLGGIEGGDS